MSVASKLLVLFAMLAPLTLARAARSEDVPATSPKLLRVGGDYVVYDIRKVTEKSYEIEFRAADPTGKFDRVVLTSDHVHMAITKGQKLRISAEVGQTKGDVAEATQVLIFLPSVQGPTPIWMLSSRSKSLDLKGSKYLEMHAPQSDYTIL